MKRNRGFTLIEIMISVGILAVIAYFSGVSIRNALQNREKVSKRFETQSQLSDVIKIMERDVNTAFNYRDFHVELYNAAEKERREKLAKDKKTPAKPAVDPATGLPVPAGETPDPQDAVAEEDQDGNFKPQVAKPVLTHFVGEAASLNFSALAYERTSSKENAGDQAEVGYFLKPCHSPLAKEETSQCLWRRISPYIDDDITTGGKATPILTNVRKFTLMFLPPKSTEWVKDWDSTGKSDETQKNVFPEAVEITISTGDDKKETTMTLVAEVRFPNNPAPAPAAPVDGKPPDGTVPPPDPSKPPPDES